MSDLAALPAATLGVVRRAGVVVPAISLAGGVASSALAGVLLAWGMNTRSQGIAIGTFAVCAVLAWITPVVFHGIAAAGFALALRGRATAAEAVRLAFRRALALAFTSLYGLFAIGLLALSVVSLLKVARGEWTPFFAPVAALLLPFACWFQGRYVSISTAVTLLEIPAGSVAHSWRLGQLARGSRLLVTATGAVPLAILVAVTVGAESHLDLLPLAVARWTRWLVPIAALPVAALANAALGVAAYAVLAGVPVEEPAP